MVMHARNLNVRGFASITSRLDFKYLCANLDKAIENVSLRKSGGDPSRVASLYHEHVQKTQHLHALRHERKTLAKQKDTTNHYDHGKRIKAEIHALEHSLDALTNEMVGVLNHVG